MISTIQLSHGSGRGLDELLHEIILPEIGIAADLPLEDAAVLKLPAGRLAFTTDSFVVQPLEFPGGNIGKLAVCGTVNDLAMRGAALSLSVSLILEEGLDTALLERVLRSLADEASRTGHYRSAAATPRWLTRARPTACLSQRAASAWCRRQKPFRGQRENRATRCL